MQDELRFLDILSVLVRHEVDFVVVGGVAAVLEGAPISTFDVDIVYERTDDNNARLAAALTELNATYKDPAGRRIVPDIEKLATFKLHLLRTDLGPLDVLIRAPDDGTPDDGTVGQPHARGSSSRSRLSPCHFSRRGARGRASARRLIRQFDPSMVTAYLDASKLFSE